MNADGIMERLRAEAGTGKSLDWRALREEIHDASAHTTSTEERVKLLSIFKVVMDLVEQSAGFSPEDLEKFKDTRAKDYRVLLACETVIGHNASVELLYAVTQREVDAGRMPPDDELRLLAIKSIAEPYMSVAELLEVEQKRATAEAKPKGWKRFFGG